jgi:hypothetical protein
MKSGPLPRTRARARARVNVGSVGSHDRTAPRLGGVYRVRTKPDLSVAALSRRVVSARDLAPAHTQVMRIIWKEITTFLAVAALVGILCLVAVTSSAASMRRSAPRMVIDACRFASTLRPAAAAQVDRHTLIAATSTAPPIKSPESP